MLQIQGGQLPRSTEAHAQRALRAGGYAGNMALPGQSLNVQPNKVWWNDWNPKFFHTWTWDNLYKLCIFFQYIQYNLMVLPSIHRFGGRTEILCHTSYHIFIEHLHYYSSHGTSTQSNPHCGFVHLKKIQHQLLLGWLYFTNKSPQNFRLWLRRWSPTPIVPTRGPKVCQPVVTATDRWAVRMSQDDDLWKMMDQMKLLTFGKCTIFLSCFEAFWCIWLLDICDISLLLFVILIRWWQPLVSSTCQSRFRVYIESKDFRFFLTFDIIWSIWHHLKHLTSFETFDIIWLWLTKYLFDSFGFKIFKPRRVGFSSPRCLDFRRATSQRCCCGIWPRWGFCCSEYLFLVTFDDKNGLQHSSTQLPEWSGFTWLNCWSNWSHLNFRKVFSKMPAENLVKSVQAAQLDESERMSLAAFLSVGGTEVWFMWLNYSAKYRKINKNNQKHTKTVMYYIFA